MKTLNKRICIFTSYREDYTVDENQRRFKTFQDILKVNDVSYKVVSGCYKGVSELSVIVDASHETLVKRLCVDFKQDSYLFSDSDRTSFLRYTDDRPDQYIGTLTPTTMEIALRSYGYTYDSMSQTYWVTQGGN